jgi:D-alanyl-D-alanine carboxypeptidase (penicillin-binding protein 5/6)
MRISGPLIEDSAGGDRPEASGDRYGLAPMVLRRKVIALAASAVVCASLVACSGDDDTLPSVQAPVDGTGAGAGSVPDSIATGTVTTLAPPPTVTTPITVAPTTVVPTAPPTPPPTPAPTPPPAPPTTVVPTPDAKAWAVLDMRSGQFLGGAEQDTPLAVGSLMKLLTAQAAYAAGDPVKVAIAPAGLIVDPEESRIGIAEGQELSRDLLVRAMLIVSANDAARMLALDVAGGEAQFADLMNQQAAGLGLTNTHAVNVTGLDQDGEYSSAADLSRLGAVLMGNQTFQLTVKRTSASLNGKTVPSTNDLLEKYPGADGIKTGHTTNAAWCITASALRDGRRIIVTVLGAPTEEARDAGATALLDWAFQQP